MQRDHAALGRVGHIWIVSDGIQTMMGIEGFRESTVFNHLIEFCLEWRVVLWKLAIASLTRPWELERPDKTVIDEVPEPDVRSKGLLPNRLVPRFTKAVVVERRPGFDVNDRFVFNAFDLRTLGPGESPDIKVMGDIPPAVLVHALDGLFGFRVERPGQGIDCPSKLECQGLPLILPQNEGNVVAGGVVIRIGKEISITDEI